MLSTGLMSKFVMLSHIIAVVHAMLIDVSNSVSRHVVSFILP